MEIHGSRRVQDETAVTNNECDREPGRVCPVVSKSANLADWLSGWLVGVGVHGAVQGSVATAANRLFSGCSKDLPIARIVALLFGPDSKHRSTRSPVNGSRRASRLRRCRSHAAAIWAKERFRALYVRIREPRVTENQHDMD